MKKKTTVRLLSYMRGSRLLLAAVFVCALLGNAALLLAPRLIGEAIDLMLPFDGSFFPALLKLLGWILGCYLLGSLLNWVTGVCATICANRTVKALRCDLFAKLQRLPLKFYDTRSHGDVLSRFSNDIDAISDGLQQGIVNLISGVIAILMSLGFMLLLNPMVTLVVVLVTPLCFVVGYFITRYGNRRFREQAETLGQLNGFAEEAISGQRTVTAFGREAQMQARFHAVNEQLYDSGYHAQFASALVNPSTRFVNNVSYVLVGVCGIALGLSTGNIAAFLSYTAQYAKPFNEITSVAMQLQAAMAAARRVFGLMDEPEQSAEGHAALPPATGRVQFEHVDFAYRADRPLITDFCLDVPAGTQVAIVGRTGAGKTTLVNLLMRFYEVDRGRILVDGTDITAIPREVLRRQFGMVLQETWLFAGSIRDNIAYGRPDATDAEIEAAARAAYAHNFIRRLPDGYHTMITEEGGNLSGGQRQLLTIARAMLSDPAMLILDEATSAVDVLTELRTQKAFARMMEGKTSFIIAHRLSTIRHADLILVMEDGHVAERGTHEQLMEKRGAYYQLYTALDR